jgi:hypothetical protein
MDSLRNLAALLRRWRPTPAEGLSKSRRSTCGPWPWAPPAIRWVLGCGHQASRAPSRLQPVIRADLARGFAPCPSSTLSRKAQAYLPVISALACTRHPTCHAHHGPRTSRAFLTSLVEGFTGTSTAMHNYIH